jgi:hypothetical protein
VRRRSAIAALFVVVGLAMMVMPASAADKPVTAKQLVAKLVKAGFCTDPTPVDTLGVAVQCTESKIYVQPNTIVIHAYRSKTAMLKALDKARVERCDEFDSILPGSRDIPANFRVGPTWWTHPYRDLESAEIAKVLGGKLKTFACD